MHGRIKPEEVAVKNMCLRDVPGLSFCTVGDGTRFLSLSGYLSPELRRQLCEARGPGRTCLAQAVLPAASGAAQTCWRVPGSAARAGALGRTPAHAVADLRASALTSVLFNPAPRFGEGSVPESTEHGRSGSRSPSGERHGEPCAKGGCAEWDLCTDWQAEAGGRTRPSLRGDPCCRDRDAAGLQGASRPRAELRGTRPGRLGDNDPGSPRRRPLAARGQTH